jgi:hypothetical protein
MVHGCTRRPLRRPHADQDKRFAYRVEEINAPGFRAVMEEWTVESTAEGRPDCSGYLPSTAQSRCGYCWESPARHWTTSSSEGLTD